MDIARTADRSWTQRAGGRATASQARTLIKVLHEGVPGTPGNFEMVLARYPAAREYPEHHHAVDQIRLTLVGSSPWAPGRATPEGSLLYIPAGTPYGPYVRPAGIELMAIQFEGAAGVPFAGEAASDEGPLPTPRFSVPIELNPAAFTWRTRGPGVEVKEMAILGEGSVRIEAVRVKPGFSWAVGADQTTLLFVTSGGGTVDGSPISEHDAVRLDLSERCTILSTILLEILVIGLNRPPEASDAGQRAPAARP